MTNFNQVDLIDIIEEYADMKDLVASEEQLSEIFDESVAPLVVEKYGEDDHVAMHEVFLEWTDSLRDDGEIHEEQYNVYEYVGKYKFSRK